MAETSSGTPEIFDISTPGLIDSLKYKDIFTDPMAAVRHRLYAANELAELITASHPDAQFGFATLPTALAAATGQLPSADPYEPLTRDTFAGYNQRLTRQDRWTNALQYAKKVSEAVGKPFYDTGDFQDIGLVMPIEGTKPDIVHTEVHKVITGRAAYFKTSIVFMGLKRMIMWDDIAAHRPAHYAVRPYDRPVEMRATDALGDATRMSYEDYALGIDVVRLLAGYGTEHAGNPAQQDSAVTTVHELELEEYELTELISRHMAGLKQLQQQYYPNGVQLRSKFDSADPIVA